MIIFITMTLHQILNVIKQVQNVIIIHSVVEHTHGVTHSMLQISLVAMVFCANPARADGCPN